ncbi:MAG TPA: P-loop NTPase [Candidatus Bathyarchaeia archaeon]|nr:P-loop NTPase [Candidatus Bathyarchaeia archaeon]
MPDLKQKLWAIGGGKGGVGKSVVTLMLGTSLARRGLRVIVADADLGGANLHTLLGIRHPLYTLADFMSRRCESMADVALATPVDNLKLISGADDILGIANSKFSQRSRILSNLEKLEADVILLDLGAGTSSSTIDFFLYCPGKIVVLSPHVTSVQNAYGFIKTSVYRRLARAFAKDDEALALIQPTVSSGLDRLDSIGELRGAMHRLAGDRQQLLDACLEEIKIDLLVNMARTVKEREVGQVVRSVAEKYLELSLDYLGFVNYDPELERSINRMATFLTTGANSIARSCMYDIATKILRRVQGEQTTPAAAPASPTAPAAAPPAATQSAPQSAPQSTTAQPATTPPLPSCAEG